MCVFKFSFYLNDNLEVLYSTFSCEKSYPNGVNVKLEGLYDPQMLQSLLVLNCQILIKTKFCFIAIRVTVEVFTGSKSCLDFSYKFDR